ncbi:MAG: glycerol-3-phosphate acyltransferase [Ruminococcaceae bacterium]|nr:glycerol-3-phosphate acyltransferase [Oscillospiraceae bacterium]
MKVLLLVITAIVSYVMGSINGAIISARFIYRRDVRAYGSGNAGLTNYYRNFGAPGVAIVILIDILKSVISILVGGWLLGIVDAALIGRLFAGFCLIMGHIFPAYYQFKGGKGALCGIVVAFMTDWRVGVCCVIVFLVIVIFTRYVSLGSVMAAILAPVFFWVFGYGTYQGLLLMFSALLIVLKHADNIVRLLKGTERRLELGGKRRKIDEDEIV